ncbi:anhydro-N-acetylmuramic acid kinase [Variovorax sp. PCZ-1]|nr:anhydro-N-acetylmuramic acid kinase [Variovorax sp. PCZ-1]
MSGTSMDGVDAALVDFSKQKPHVAGIESAQIAIDLRASLMALNSSGADELHTAALAANALMRLYAQAVNALLAKTGLKPQDIRAIGAHGQTVRHRPQMFDGTGYTIQLCNPSLLAELTGIDVVADLRSRDVAAGGQGAPLAPFFHRAWFAQESTVGVLNIGGISNLTVLQSDGNTLGFDCGPGNALMDFWIHKHGGQSFDAGGAWGAGGQIISALLEQMLEEPYFALPYPKSTGRDLFNPEWLAKHLANFADAKPQDIQRTLLELTASSIATCASSYEKQSNQTLKELIVCGGGAFNTALMQRLQALLPETNVISSAQRGLPPQDVEAVAFAWLAKQCVERVALPLTSVTGARGARILGGIYPA